MNNRKKYRHHQAGIPVDSATGPRLNSVLPICRWLAAFLIIMGIHQNVDAVEKISFDLKFGMVKGGSAVMTIRDTVFNGNKAINYHLRGRTTGVTDKLFKVNDIYESTLDAKTYLPYRALRNIRERSYRYYNEVFFFQDKDSVYSEKTGGMKVPHKLSDFLTVFFYFVKNNLVNDMDKGHTVELATMHGHEVKNIKIKFIGFETVESKMGMIECYVLSPVVDKGKVLKRADGVKFYISRDTKIPIQLDFDMKVGTLRAVLDSYKINGKEQINRKK